MRRLDFGIAAFAAALLLAVVVWFQGPTEAQVTQIVPVVSSGTVSANTVVQLVTINPSRHSIRICNTGATNNAWIFPSSLAATQVTLTSNLVSDYVLAPLASNVISCYTPPTGLVGQGLEKAIGPTNGWYGYSAAGTGISVEEW